MFPQLKKINNESGIVLFIVLMTAIIIMIFCVGILTQSANEVNYAQQQVDQIESDELAKGLFWNAYSNGAFAGSYSNVINSRQYNQAISTVSTGVTNQYQMTVSYDTF